VTLPCLSSSQRGSQLIATAEESVRALAADDDGPADADVSLASPSEAPALPTSDPGIHRQPRPADAQQPVPAPAADEGHPPTADSGRDSVASGDHGAAQGAIEGGSNRIAGSSLHEPAAALHQLLLQDGPAAAAPKGRMHRNILALRGDASALALQEGSDSDDENGGGEVLDRHAMKARARLGGVSQMVGPGIVGRG
jgi:hypothetical protein